MKKIWTLAQIAKAFGISRQRIHIIRQEGRLTHDIEDQDGQPYYSRLPEKPKDRRIDKPKK